MNAYDLNGLLADGGPKDEYEPEVAALVSHMSRLRPEQHLGAETVAAVWHQWFGMPEDPVGPPTESMIVLARDREHLRHRFDCI